MAKKTGALIGLLILVAMGCLVAFMMVGFDKSEQEKPASRDTSKNQDIEIDENSPMPNLDPVEPPKISVPKVCDDLKGTIKDIIGSGAAANGREVKAKANNLTECNYSKDEQRINVRIYQYESEEVAKADMSQVDISGYETQNKGKYNVSVMVVSGTTPDATAASKILGVAMERL